MTDDLKEYHGNKVTRQDGECRLFAPIHLGTYCMICTTLGDLSSYHFPRIPETQDFDNLPAWLLGGVNSK